MFQTTNQMVYGRYIYTTIPMVYKPTNIINHHIFHEYSITRGLITIKSPFLLVYKPL